MLMLSRRVGETIVIGEGTDTVITITVAEVNGRPTGSVRLSFDAPADVPIWRGEVDADTPQGDPA